MFTYAYTPRIIIDYSRFGAYIEFHSPSGRTYIEKRDPSRWNVFLDGTHVATFFTRRCAREYIRACKKPSLFLGFQA